MKIILLKRRHTLRNYSKRILSKLKRQFKLILPGLKRLGTYEYWRTLIREWTIEMWELWMLTRELMCSPWWTFPWWLLLWMALNIFLKIALLYWSFCNIG